MLDEKERLAVVETKVEALASDIHEIKADVRIIADTMAQAKGGWKTLLLVAGVAGTMGAIMAKLIPFMPWR